MPALKPCLGCGRATRQSRCPDCVRPLKQVRNREARLAREMRDSGLPCRICGSHGTEDNPVTLGHDKAVVLGGTAEDGYGPECRRCNSRKGAS